MITALALAATVVASVADADSLYTDDARTLTEVVVTGTRAPKLLKDTPVQTLVITSKEIERTDATDIADLLQRAVPAAEFSYAMNQQRHLNFGGFGGQSVLFLVDGERLSGETLDDVDFSRINMADVERVEIVRGASSALYGGNAAGGVINIITRRPRKEFSASASARLARHNDQRYELTMSGKYRRVDNSISAQYSRIDSYDVHSSAQPPTRVITTIYGDRTFNVRDRVSVDAGRGIKISARAGYYFRELPRVVDTPERYRAFSGGATGKWAISSYDNLEIAYAFDQYDKSSYMRITDMDVRSYSNVTNSFRSIYTHTFNGGDQLTAGADYRYDYLDNVKLVDRTRHEINADLFAQYDWIVTPQWEIVGAARYDYFSLRHTSRVTPRVSARYRPTSDINLRLAYGMGFRTPTLKERFYSFDMAGIWIVEGNENLQPETSHNINGSFEWTHGAYSLTATAYYNYVADKIATGLPYYKEGEGSQLFLQYVNLDRYSVAGGEITLSGRWRCGLSARLSYAYTHESFAKEKDGNIANNQYIPARPSSLNANLEWYRAVADNFNITLALNGRVYSEVTNIEYRNYYDLSQGTVDVRYPAYTLWKLSATASFRNHIKLTLAVDNLFNYKPKYYYLNAPLTDGANFMAGLSVGF